MMKKADLLTLMLFLGIFLNQTIAQTTITLRPDSGNGKDASVLSANADKNYGEIESLVSYTWTYSGELAQKRIFIEFDFSSIPEDATILDAKLSLFYNPTDTTEPTFHYHTGDNDIYIQRVTSQWDEDIITWNNQPATSTINQAELPPSSSQTQDYLDIDVTDLVTDMNTPPYENNGFMIRMADEINPYKCVLFASSNHQDSLLHPKLEITYIQDSVNCTTLKPDAGEGKDASVLSANANKNYGEIESLVAYTWTYGGELALKRVFFEFDFSSIPENAIITNAQLSLFYNPTDSTEPTFDYHTGDNNLKIQRVRHEWDESIITWNNQPLTTTVNQVELPPSTSPTQDYLDIDVTELVVDMTDPLLENNGFMLKVADEVNPYKCVLFASSNHTDSKLHPEITVCWYIDTLSVPDTKSNPDYIFEVFPNPNQGEFEINLPENISSDYTIEIFSLTGQKITNYKTDNIHFNIMDKGIFIISLTDGNGNRVNRKVVVK